YPNLHMMTSAWAPKYLPESLLHYMRTRGKKKVIFASDAPVLSITRTVGEATRLDLPAEVLDNYLYGNAQRFFFDRMETATGPAVGEPDLAAL
nr:amidohydrolase family protein [Micromonospora sp. DSM 115978]